MTYFRIGKRDFDKMVFSFAVTEDIDFSGHQAGNETVCIYDEGLLAGVLKVDSGKEFDAREIDCRASGDIYGARQVRGALKWVIATLKIY